MMNCLGRQTKMNKPVKRMNVKKSLLQGVILLCVIWYQGTFLAAFFGETGGIVKYAEWIGDGGGFRRMDIQYDAAFALGIAVTVIFVLEIGVILYGVRTGTALVLPAAIAGMLLFYGAMVQVLYGENALILHTALTIAGAVLALVCTRYVKHGLSEWLWKVLLIMGGIVTLAVLAVVVAERFVTIPVIEGGGISVGDVVFYPGDILKVLLIFLAACCFTRKSDRNMTKLYSGLAITAAIVLVLFGDGGNAFIILVIFAICSAYLYEKRSTVLKIVLALAAGIVCAQLIIPEAGEAFQGCFHMLTRDIAWKSTSLSAVLAGGIRGTGAGDGICAVVGSRYFNITDCSSVLAAVYGVHALIILAGAVLCLLVLIFKMWNRKTYIHMLGTLGTAALFVQYMLHIGGFLNILPSYGTAAPFISADISGMAGSFLLLGMMIAALQEENNSVDVFNEGYGGTKRSILVLPAAAGTVFTAVLVIGLAGVILNGKNAAGLLGYRLAYEWNSDTGRSFGHVLDCEGRELWSWNRGADEDMAALLGTTSEVSLEKDTILDVYEPYLTGCADYNFTEGERSLKEAGQDITLTIDSDINRTIYEYMQQPGSESGMAVIVETKTGAVRAASAWLCEEPAGTPEWQQAIESIKMISAAVNGGSIQTPYLTEMISGSDGSMTEYHDGNTEKIMEKEEADELWQTWTASSVADGYKNIIVAEQKDEKHTDGSETHVTAGYVQDRDLAFYIRTEKAADEKITDD